MPDNRQRDETVRDSLGFPIDLTRPAAEVDVVNEETGGSRKGYETEYAIAVSGAKIRGADPARWYLIPGIWDGEKRLVEGTDTEYGMIDEKYIAGRAASEMENGWEFPNFESLEAANEAAPQRVQSVGVERGKRNLPGGSVQNPPVPQFGIPPGALPPAPPPLPAEDRMSRLLTPRGPRR